MQTRLPFVVSLISIAVTATSGAVLAQQRSSGPYGELAGGGNHQRDENFGAGNGDVEFDEGGVGAISLGYASARGWRPALEYAFRENDTENGNGSVDVDAATANLWYDFGAPGFAPRLRPFLGVGAGSAEVSWDQIVDPSGTVRSNEDDVAAYQAGAGLGFQATRNLALSLGYRYLTTDKVRFDGAPGSSNPLNPSPAVPAADARYRSDSVLASLRYTFGGREEPVPVAQAEEPVPAPAPPPAEVAAFETVVLRPVNFQFDQADLTPPSRQTLDEIAAQFAEHPDLRVSIEGYTDAIGSPDYNHQLGQRRAEAVRDYLVGKGVPAENLEVASRGENDPEAPNDTDDGRAHNRRAELAPQEKPADVRIVLEPPTEASVDAAKSEGAAPR